MEKKDWKNYLKNNLLSLFVLVSLIALGAVIAGDVFIDQGSIEVSNDLNVSGDFFVDSVSGMIGIGTNNPVSKLDVQGSLGLEVDTITTSTTLNDTHNIVLADNTVDVTVTLPAASSNTDKTYYIMKTDSGTAIVTIDGNGAETINGQTTVVLYIQYDAIRIVSDGSNWFIISDELRPHMVKMTRDAAQSIPDSATTTIEFDNTVFDIGGLADLANNKATIRRAGKYMIAAGMGLANIDDNERVELTIFRNVASEFNVKIYSTGTDNTMGLVSTNFLDLVVGDDIFLKVAHTEGAAQNTLTELPNKPRISIVEIRP